MNKLALLSGIFVLAGCTEKLPEPVCYGRAMIGGVDTKIPVYAIRQEGNYAKYKAGSVYNWRWVGSGAFTRLDCPKSVKI